MITLSPELQTVAQVIGYVIAVVIATLISGRFTQSAVKRDVQTTTDDLAAAFEKRWVNTHDELVATKVVLENAEDALKEAQRRIGILESDVKNYHEREIELKGQFTQLQTQKRDDDERRLTERDTFKKQIDDLQSQLQELRDNLLTLATANDTLAKEKAAAENRENVLKDHAYNLENKNKSLMIEIDGLKARVDELKGKIEDKP